jgi:cytochrome c oxidase subunit IV
MAPGSVAISRRVAAITAGAGVRNIRLKLIAVFAVIQTIVLISWVCAFAYLDPYFIFFVFLLFMLIPAGVLLRLFGTVSHRSLARAYILLTANTLVFAGYVLMSSGDV